MNEAQARKRVKELRDYYGHLTSYVGVNAALFTMNLLVSPGEWWFIFPLLGWGIGFLSHTVQVFGIFGIGGREWEEQKLQELMGQSATQDELERLSRRIEDLSVLVTSRRWPEGSSVVQQAEEGLRAAAPNPSDSASGRALRKERLHQLVEHLETIVTSPEFQDLERVDETPPPLPGRDLEFE